MDEAPPSRFTVRQGPKGYMVWDRERCGSAMQNGTLMIGLSRVQAVETRDHLEMIAAGRPPASSPF
jgi:hypothetical protein